jgi:CheY-like chemotaxis protein
MRAQRPDLVVCDLQMPIMNGYQLLKAVREDPALQSIIVIAVTALSMPGDKAEVMTAGFDGYLSKPIEPETFVLQLEAYLPNELRARR